MTRNIQIITSKENETIKHVKKLKEKKYRDEANEYIIEGIKMIKEAIQEKAKIKMIIVCDDCETEGTIDSELRYEIAKYNCVYVNSKIFQYITDVKNPQGILAVIDKTIDETKIDFSDEIFFILDGVQDPGNMGTILRTADSIGLKQLIVSKESADVFNPKVVRSTMGAIFRINVIESDDLIKTIKELKKRKIQVYATSLEESESIYEIEYNKAAIVIGNEANGVSKAILDICDKKIKIPMLGKTESLNASVATGIIMYEAMRKLEKF